MKIGIICAVPREFEAFLPHIQNKKITKKAKLNFHEGKINDIDIVILFCGVCKTNAAIATQILIDNFNAQMIINSGTAGGMDESLNVFDTVICTEVAHHDVNEDILTENHPFISSVYFKADDLLVELSQKAVTQLSLKNKIYFGRMVTGECFITNDGRDEINSTFKPLSVDMETASIAQVCHVNEIPFISIRTITDNLTHCGVEHFENNVATASGISKDIVIELLEEIKAGYR